MIMNHEKQTFFISRIQNLFLLQILAAIQILKKKDIVLMGRQPTESWLVILFWKLKVKQTPI